MTESRDPGRVSPEQGARLPHRSEQDPFRSSRRAEDEFPTRPSSAGATQSDDFYQGAGNRNLPPRPAQDDPFPHSEVAYPVRREQPSSDQPSLTQYPAGRQPSSAAQPQGQDRQDGHEARTGYPPRTAPSPSRRQPHQSSPTASTPSVKPQSRIPFWAGFALSFLLLTIASLGLLVLSTGVDRFDFSSLQGGESAWAPPEIIPTATIDAAQVGGVVASSSGGAYGTGAILRNVTGTNVRIRQTPGNLSKPDGDVIAGIPAGGRVEVIGGPSVVDGLTWWLIRYTTTSGQMIEGWSAEVTASGLRILGPEQ